MDAENFFIIIKRPSLLDISKFDGYDPDIKARILVPIPNTYIFLFLLQFVPKELQIAAIKKYVMGMGTINNLRGETVVDRTSLPLDSIKSRVKLIVRLLFQYL